MVSMDRVVIIGNGVAGVTAARHIRKIGGHKITIVSSEAPYFFSRTALMYVYMGHMKFEHTKPYEDRFWKKNRLDLVFDHAEKIDTQTKTVILRSGGRLQYDKLIIATGSRSNSLDVPGKELPGVQSLYSYQDLQAMEQNTRQAKHAVVVGGGLIGVEMAEMLRSRKIQTTMLVREPAFWNNVLPLEDARMISKHIMSHGVDIRHEDELAMILPGEDGKVRGIVTTKGDKIACEFVGIAVGVSPNVSWLKGSSLSINRGILVNEYLETNIPDIYAIGDCVERLHAIEGRQNIEQVWYTARMMGETVARTVCGERTAYRPGPWFNSAKFFDIEFQTYGNVPNVPHDTQEDFYWEDASGTKAVHVVWDRHTNVLSGINAFGVRLRHECFDRWIRERRTIDYVLDHLPEANFDPEWSKRHEGDIKRHYLKHRTINV